MQAELAGTKGNACLKMLTLPTLPAHHLKEWHVLILPLHVVYLDAKAYTLMTLAVAVQQHLASPSVLGHCSLETTCCKAKASCPLQQFKPSTGSSLFNNIT